MKNINVYSYLIVCICGLFWNVSVFSAAYIISWEGECAAETGTFSSKGRYEKEHENMVEAQQAAKEFAAKEMKCTNDFTKFLVSFIDVKGESSSSLVGIMKTNCSISCSKTYPDGRSWSNSCGVDNCTNGCISAFCNETSCVAGCA